MGDYISSNERTIALATVGFNKGAFCFGLLVKSASPGSRSKLKYNPGQDEAVLNLALVVHVIHLYTINATPNATPDRKCWSWVSFFVHL